MQVILYSVIFSRFAQSMGRNFAIPETIIWKLLLWPPASLKGTFAGGFVDDKKMTGVVDIEKTVKVYSGI